MQTTHKLYRELVTLLEFGVALHIKTMYGSPGGALYIVVPTHMGIDNRGSNEQLPYSVLHTRGILFLNMKFVCVSK